MRQRRLSNDAAHATTSVYGGGLSVPVERLTHVELLSFRTPGIRWDRVMDGPAAVTEIRPLNWYFVVAGSVFGSMVCWLSGQARALPFH